jgi:hypothetical protein
MKTTSGVSVRPMRAVSGTSLQWYSNATSGEERSCQDVEMAGRPAPVEYAHALAHPSRPRQRVGERHRRVVEHDVMIVVRPPRQVAVRGLLGHHGQR